MAVQMFKVKGKRFRCSKVLGSEVHSSRFSGSR
jgi:hypothetical protein